MEQKEFIAKQHEALDAFYKETMRKSGIHIGYWLVAGVFGFCAACILLIPYQIMEDGTITGMTVMMSVGTTLLYMSAFDRYQNDKGVLSTVYSRLKFHPVSSQILNSYRLKKLVRFQLRFYLPIQIGQLFFSIVCLHEVVLANFCYPMLVALVLPLLIAGTMTQLKQY
ncbi:MAG: hypothetical protein IJ379_13005 [Lachnospiraceae bacterium]|nr:hypothetical protein [Lachnospiraceae bacterium]